MNFRNTLLLVAGVTGMMIGMLCSNPVQTAGNGSNVGNGMVAGLIVDENGNGVKGVTVYLRKRSMLADTTGALLKRLASTADTAITNDIGKFVIDSIDTGTYVIEGVSGDNLCLNDSIAVTDPDSTVALPPDTLKPAGAIRGVIRLSEGGDPRKVFVLAFGIDRFARVEADGRFKFSTLAEAAYDLRIISSLDDYGVLDTVNIHVISADTTNLDTLELPFTGIPTVKGLSLNYDTLKQIVTLTWNQADTGLVSGYNVYRKHVDSGLVKLNSGVITDTVFKDSTALQDNSYTYQVKSVDKSGNEGLLSAGVVVKAVSAFALVARFPLGSIEPFKFIISNDSLVYVVYRTQGYVGVFNMKGDSVNAFGKGMFAQLYDIAVDSKGLLYVVDPDWNKVVKFSSNGDYILQWPIDNPTFIEIDNQDNIYICFSNEDSLARFDTAGNFTDPLDFIIAKKKIPCIGDNDNIYISDYENLQLQQYDTSGNMVNSFAVRAELPTYRIFAVDSHGNMYLNRDVVVGSGGMNEVCVYDQNGALLAVFGPFGTLNDLVVRDSWIFLTCSQSDPWRYSFQTYTNPL